MSAKSGEQVGLTIIGAGFGRTGTLSTKAALERLGFRCYHMEEALRRWHFPKWLDKVNSTVPMDWSVIFSDYAATVDFPACLHYQELMERYPDAVVLLTTRESASWWSSFSSTLLDGYRTIRGCFWLKLLPPVRLLNRFQADVVFRIFGAEPIERKTAIDVFERHNDQVRATVPAERLLEFDVKQGWEPLCQFLKKPVPDEPFPHVNDTDEFRKRISLIKFANWLLGFGCLGLAVLATWTLVALVLERW